MESHYRSRTTLLKDSGCTEHWEGIQSKGIQSSGLSGLVQYRGSRYCFFSCFFIDWISPSSATLDHSSFICPGASAGGKLQSNYCREHCWPRPRQGQPFTIYYWLLLSCNGVWNNISHSVHSSCLQIHICMCLANMLLTINNCVNEACLLLLLFLNI